MAQRYQDIGDAFFVSSHLRLPVQFYCRRPGLLIKDFDVQHARCGALGFYTERLEHSLFSCPADSEGSLRRRLRLAIRYFKRREVAGHKCGVRRRYSGNELYSMKSDAASQKDGDGIP